MAYRMSMEYGHVKDLPPPVRGGKKVQKPQKRKRGVEHTLCVRIRIDDASRSEVDVAIEDADDEDIEQQISAPPRTVVQQESSGKGGSSYVMSFHTKCIKMLIAILVENCQSYRFSRTISGPFIFSFLCAFRYWRSSIRASSLARAVEVRGIVASFEVWEFNEHSFCS